MLFYDSWPLPSTIVTTTFLWSPPVNLKLCCTSSMIDATVHNFWMCVYTNFCRGCLITCQYSYVLCLVLCVYDPYRYFLWHVYSINCPLWPSITCIAIFYGLYENVIFWVNKIQISNCMTCYGDFYDFSHMLLCLVSRTTDGSKSINLGFYDA